MTRYNPHFSSDLKIKLFKQQRQKNKVPNFLRIQEIEARILLKYLDKRVEQRLGR